MDRHRQQCPSVHRKKYESFSFLKERRSHACSSCRLFRCLLDSRAIFVGVVGNRVLDKEIIKGFNFEVSIDSIGDLGSWTSGHFALHDLSTATAADGTLDTTQCAALPLLYLATGGLKSLEFAGAVCCEKCAEDPDCVFTVSDAQHCFLAMAGETTVMLIDETFNQSGSRAGFLRETTICLTCAWRVDASLSMKKEIP